MPHSLTALWTARGTTALRFTVVAALIAGTALFAYQTPAKAQSGAMDPDLGTPVPTTPVSGSAVDFLSEGLTTPSGKITVPSAGGSGGSSATGDWSATDLSNAGSWSQGGSTGGFNYSYGLELPPAEGPVPAVGLSYSSQAVDGHTSSSNNQAGVIGDGWSYTPGYIERTYTACMSEEGGNTPPATADRCWDGKSPSITLVLDGVNSTVVLDDATNKWVASADPNWKVELLGSAATASAATSERWRITTTNGTVYTFGARAADTGSRLTVPVFGNHSGESCYKADDFAGSDCKQAYRWMLDEVTDAHGNRARFEWATETGHYGAAVDEDDRVSFHRAARLTRIDYGLRADDPAVQAGRVSFTYTDRCEADCFKTDGTPKADSWPETPWDSECASAPCTDLYSPAFFSSKRLSTITTYVPNGAGGFTKIDSWALVQEFLDYGDGEDTVLWLKSIQHTGHVGGTASTPPVTFSGIAFPNRVEHSEGTPSMWRTRLTAITSETGAVTGVWYSEPSCTWDELPGKVNNSELCYPTLSDDGDTEEWFHKYVVTEVAQFDTTAGQLPVRTYFDYATAGGGTTRLWGWDDSEFTDDALRTYNQWRGYPQVTTKTGDPNEDTQLTSRTRYYRGMDGQPNTASGTGSITVELTDAEGGTVADHEALAGAVFETASYDGTTIIASTVSQYWKKLVAERDHDGGTLKAWLTGQSRSDSRELLDTATWRRTATAVTYDGRGRATAVSDLGDLASSADGDERCTRTWYADNASANRYDLVSRTETVAVACDATAAYPADLIAENRFFYDGDTADTEVAPTRGLLTSTEVRDGYDGTAADWIQNMSASYDDLGRVESVADALDRTTTTAYTPANGGPVASVTTTNALGHTTTVHADQIRGLPVKTVDANDRVTEIVYDPLGRTTAVWGPGWSKSTYPEVPSASFDYEVSNSEPSAVTSYSVSPTGRKRLNGVVLYDSLLRQVQAQVPTANGGRLLTGVEYDTRGMTVWTSGPNWDSDNDPGTDLVYVAQGEDQARTFYTYDGAGRMVTEAFMSHQEILHSTETTYGGSTEGWMVSVDPPEGATPTAVITNARGELIEKRDFHGEDPTGNFDATTYAYDHRGNLAKVTDPAGNEWTYGYDLRGRQVRATDPDTGTTTAAYDEAGQLIATTDARGETLTTTYDALGRRTNLYSGDEDGTRLNAWRYDSVSGGKGLPYLSVSYVDGTAVITEVRKYDSAGRPTSVTQWVPELDGLEALQGSYNVQQFYLPDGSVSNINLPQVSGLPGEVVAFDYNDLGQVTRVYGNPNTSTESVDYVSEATYTAFGELAQRVLGDNAGEKVYQTWTYQDGTRRTDQHWLSRDSVSSPGVARLKYEYDEAGNITSIADGVTDSPSEPERQCFVYDYLQRLTEAWAQAGTGECEDVEDLDGSDLGGLGAYWTSYEYDVTGNRTAVTDHHLASGTSTTSTYTYTDTEAHLVDSVSTTTTANSYEWDASGNLTERTINGSTETLDWNAVGKLASITSDEGTTTMIYDGENNRLGRIDADGTQNLFVAGHEIVVDPQGVMHATRTYSHNGEMVATRSTDTGLTWIGTTHQGTAAWAISAATLVLTYRRQDPFGNDRGDAVNWTATQQGFHTGTEDPTGLVSMGARFYDPTTGRFISRDPIQAFTDTQQINGYSYSNNNPVNMSDPTGLWSCIDGDCSYHNNDGSLKNEEQCKKTGCGTGQCTRGSCSSKPKPAPGITTDCPPQWCGTNQPGNGEDWNTGNFAGNGGDILETPSELGGPETCWWDHPSPWCDPSNLLGDTLDEANHLIGEGLDAAKDGLDWGMEQTCKHSPNRMPDFVCEKIGFYEYFEIAGVTTFVSNCVQSYNENPVTTGATVAVTAVGMFFGPPGALIGFGVGVAATCIDANTDWKINDLWNLCWSILERGEQT